LTIPYESDLGDLEELDVHASLAEVVTWRGRTALHLNGLALVRGLEVSDATIEVAICAEEACYPGVSFRVWDVLNFELAYAVPHCSGVWDAIQYDPVFHGSNTWQLYHGERYQKAAIVPTGQWFHLHIDVQGELAAISVDGQPPLEVPGLAHSPAAGRVGLWTYLPAYFSNLRVSPCEGMPEASSESPQPAPDAWTEWFVDGYGRVQCEPSGVLNLNRYLPASLGEVLLTRRFEMSTEAEVEVAFGFSDELALAVDGAEMFTGANTFKGFGSYEERGYAHLGAHSVRLRLGPGIHQLSALLKVTEGFGWGLIVALRGEGIQLLPADSG
jgi:hypothetical protein